MAGILHLAQENLLVDLKLGVVVEGRVARKHLEDQHSWSTRPKYEDRKFVMHLRVPATHGRTIVCAAQIITYAGGESSADLHARKMASPRAHQSTALPCPWLWMISGAKYSGVPQSVQVRSVTSLANPARHEVSAAVAVPSDAADPARGGAQRSTACYKRILAASGTGWSHQSR